jgi:hypothetical protein
MFIARLSRHSLGLLCGWALSAWPVIKYEVFVFVVTDDIDRICANPRQSWLSGHFEGVLEAVREGL